MSKEFYKRYRPKSLKGVIGQDSAIASLQKLIDKGEIPHAILLSGPSGSGKTTIARILKEILKCGDADYSEMNSADFRGIDMVREIRRNMNLSAISGDTRIWLIDEAHQLTGGAQEALLKMLEDTPEHVYFLLATTNPGKLIKTIHTRCTEVKLAALSTKALERVIQRVCEKEKLELSEDVVEGIIEAADGSARKALVILQQVGSIEGEDEQIKAIQSTTFTKEQALDLARLLVTAHNTGWADVAKVLRAIKDEDAEGIRYCVLGYARACMVGGEGKAPNLKLGERAFKVIDIFGRNFYDSKHAGLAAACWEVITR